MNDNPYQSPLTPGEPRPRRRFHAGSPHIGWAIFAAIVGAVLGSNLTTPAMPNRGDPVGLFLGGMLGLAGYFIVRFLRFLQGLLKSRNAHPEA